jgi:hypothetical protein
MLCSGEMTSSFELLIAAHTARELREPAMSAI